MPGITVAIANLEYIIGADKGKIYETDIMPSLAIVPGYDTAMMMPAQIRAARAMLGWKQTDLALAAGVSEISVKNIERGATDARGSTLGKIQTAFENAGLEIIPAGGASLSGGLGVRFRK
jgi:DNA-binding XRE family transcriptional regulator